MKKAMSLLTLLVVSVSLFLTNCGGGQNANAQNTAPQEKINVRQELKALSTLEAIKKRGEIRIGFEAGYMPFSMTDKNGNYMGFDIDIHKELAKALGVKYVPVNTDWHGIIPSLTTEKFDIILGGMTITQERNLRVNFTDPYIVVGQGILVHKKHAKKIKSYKDLNNKKYTVVSQLGTTGEKAIKSLIPKAKYKSFEKSAEAAMEVISGRADAFVYDTPFCAVFAGRQGKGKVVFLDQPFTYEPLAWAVNKGDPDFLNWLNNFMNQLKNDGRYDRFYNKWFKTSDWQQNLK